MKEEMELQPLEIHQINGAAWSGREPDELIHELFRLGWNHRDSILEWPAIGKSRPEIVRASQAVLQRLVKASTSSDSLALVRHFIRDTTTGDGDATSDCWFIDLF
jgi:hypothetical protein